MARKFFFFKVFQCITFFFFVISKSFYILNIFIFINNYIFMDTADILRMLLQPINLKLQLIRIYPIIISLTESNILSFCTRKLKSLRYIHTFSRLVFCL